MRLCVPHAHSLSCNVLDFFGERQTELLANKLCVKSVKRLLISVGIPKVHLTKAQPLMRFYTYSNPIPSTSACADLMEFSSGKLKMQFEPIAFGMRTQLDGGSGGAQGVKFIYAEKPIEYS